MILALMMLAQVDFDNIQMVLIWVVRMMLLEWATNAALLDLDTKTTRSFSLKGSTLRCVSCQDLEWILALLALVTSTFFGLRIFFRQNTTQQKSQSLCLPSNHIRSKSAKPTRTEDKAVFAACMNSVPPYVHFCNSMDNAPPYVYYCGTRTTGSFSLTGLTLRYVSCKDPEWILALLALVTSTFFGHRIFFLQNTTQQKSQSLCLPWNHIRSKSAKPTRTGNKAVFAACMDSVPPHVYYRIST